MINSTTNQHKVFLLPNLLITESFLAIQFDPKKKIVSKNSQKNKFDFRNEIDFLKV